MVYMGGLARELAAAVYVAGAKSPGHARGVGAIPVPTVEAALEEAVRHVGREPRVLVVPDLSKPAFHLTAEHPA
jgi:KaiC/GvpD/RAD55 family RecA-like ATPase